MSYQLSYYLFTEKVKASGEDPKENVINYESFTKLCDTVRSLLKTYGKDVLFLIRLL